MGNNNNNNKSIFKAQNLVPRDYSKHVCAHTHTHTHTRTEAPALTSNLTTQQRLTSNVTKPLDIHIMISPVFGNNSGFLSTMSMR